MVELNDILAGFKQAASRVDRILAGAKGRDIKALVEAYDVVEDKFKQAARMRQDYSRHTCRGTN